MRKHVKNNKKEQLAEEITNYMWNKGEIFCKTLPLKKLSINTCSHRQNWLFTPYTLVLVKYDAM